MTTPQDIQLFAVSSAPAFGVPGGITRIRTSIHGRIGVSSLPSDMNWELSFQWGMPDRSMMTCTAEVKDPSGTVVSTTGKLLGSIIPASTAGRATLALPPFRITVTGTYVVILRVDVESPWVEQVSVILG